MNLLPLVPLLPLLLVGCARKPVPDDTGDTADTDTGDTADTDTADTGETDDTDTGDTDTGDTGDTDTGDTDTGDTGDTGGDEDWSTGIRLVDEDTTSFRDEGYTLLTFEVGPDYRVPMESPDGLAPTFSVLWPAFDDGSVDRRVVMMLHGGSLGVIGGYNEDSCNQAAALSQGTSNIVRSGFARLVARQGGVVVGPHNPWCDGWIGRGPDDPATTDQFGYLLAQAAYNYVRFGQTEVRVDSRGGSVVGTSFGAPGAVWYAANDPSITALVADSGFTDAVRMYEEEDYSPVALESRQEIFDHVAGGPPREGSSPTEWYPTYASWGLVQNLQSGFTTPTFHLWNAQDPLSLAAQHDEVAAELEAAWGDGSVRYLEWDVNHPQPDHTQTKDFASFYAAWAAWEFVSGKQVRVYEAETTLGSTVGSVIHARGDIQSYSDESGREADAADGPGVLLRVEPGVVPAGAAFSVAFFVDVENSADPSAPAGILRLYEDGAQVASLEFDEDTLSWSSSRFPERYDAFLASHLLHTSGGGEIAAEVEVYGNATVRADLAVAAW